MLLNQLRDLLSSRGQAYRKTFAGIYGQRVLDDLAPFCRANKSTFHTDARLEGILQGRREVWLRITQNLNLTEEELWAHYNVKDNKE